MSGFGKFLIFATLLFAGVKYGARYMLSDDFERYADETKKPWTCQYEVILGKLHYMRDKYDSAMFRYSHAIARCPETPIAQEAEFEIARCLEGKGMRRAAHDAYLAFSQKYPGTPLGKIADKSVEILQGS